MKKLVLLFFATAAMTLVSCGGSSSEGSSDSEKQSQEEMAANAGLPEKEATNNAVVDWGDDVLKSAPTMPSFPEGTGALMQYISRNIRYPQAAKDANIEGKVVVQFVVEKDGRVGEARVVRGVDKNLDEEAIRVCKSLPKFNPGKNADGEPVRVVYTLPVNFKNSAYTETSSESLSAAASGSTTCSKCGGSGKVKCSKCHGRGTTRDSGGDGCTYGCKKCGGSGYAEGDYNNVRRGSGKMKCPECNGSGKI